MRFFEVISDYRSRPGMDLSAAATTASFSTGFIEQVE